MKPAILEQGGLVRIVEFSIQSNHVHLVVEAANSADLSRGMQSLNTGLGMRLNRIWHRTGLGSVFKERFHLVVIDNPTQMRRVLNYVLRNDVHHGLELRTLDPCSSAPSFGGWKELQGPEARAKTAKAARACVSLEPETWLLKTGWQVMGEEMEQLSTGQWPRAAKTVKRRARFSRASAHGLPRDSHLRATCGPALAFVSSARSLPEARRPSSLHAAQ